MHSPETFQLESPPPEDVLRQLAALEAEAAELKAAAPQAKPRPVKVEQTDLFDFQGALF